MTTSDRAKAAADYLIVRRAKDAELPATLPDDLKPRSVEEAIAIHQATIAELGPVGGWKVGAGNAAPLLASGIKLSPATVASRKRLVECEIGFRLGDALPTRDKPYERADVLKAIEFCQATIEIVDPRYRDHTVLEPLAIAADLGMHGGLVVGRPIESWNPDMFSTLPVELEIDGKLRKKDIGSNAAGIDLLALVTWLANSDFARAFGGLNAGAYITTGSWTGLEVVPPGGIAVAKFAGFPKVEVTFDV